MQVPGLWQESFRLQASWSKILSLIFPSLSHNSNAINSASAKSTQKWSHPNFLFEQKDWINKKSTAFCHSDVCVCATLPSLRDALDLIFLANFEIIEEEFSSFLWMTLVQGLDHKNILKITKSKGCKAEKFSISWLTVIIRNRSRKQFFTIVSRLLIILFSFIDYWKRNALPVTLTYKRNVIKKCIFPKHDHENAVFLTKTSNVKQKTVCHFQFFRSFIADWKQDYIFNLFSWSCWLKQNT